ncbi:nucleotide pyrophosphohydrolase [Thermococcus stetteri]|uniref:nucleotide pyrophosphohydrolase n=1 Tax=Thermococcus stetteri TaxID=49900 RepID=UPI001FD7E86B|nr:nucleotide pyrophosphohydrolase [Thermococcus stetteri]MBP1911774.1 NTP pyrophosphatase (non-canonical NTP hydrolase) [Thermococcus stetteri]
MPVDFRELEKLLVEFRDARNWKKYHTPKNLAISAVVELGELFEHFQWLSDEEILEAVKDPQKKEDIADEIADVIIYLVLLAHELEIDLDKAVDRKIRENKAKYPLSKG